MTLDSNMLVINLWRILSYASKNIILYQWTGMGNYIVVLVLIGNIKTNLSPYICKYMWREPCININTKGQQDPSIHHTNGKYHIMGPKLNGQPMRATNISPHLKLEIIYKRWWENFSIMKNQLTPLCY